MSKRLRVLLIEDDPEYVILMSHYFSEACGDSLTYILESAETLAAALDRLQASEFDIAVLDLNLPDSTGLETLDAVLGAGRGVPVVVLTNMDQQRFGLEAITRGAQDFLLKSRVDAQRLQRAIGFAFERQRIYGQMEGLVEASPDGMVIVDAKKCVRYVNSAAKTLLGRDPGEMLGRPFEHPLRPDRPTEIELRSGEDEPRSVEIRSAAVDWKGERAMLACLRDVTETKKLARLRAEIQERRRVDEMKDRLHHTVSHELRNPLSVVRAVVRGLLTGLGGAMTEKQADLIQRADKHTERMTHLVNNFLDLARLESGKAELSPRPVDPVALASEVIAEFRLARELEGVSIGVRARPGIGPVSADPELFEQLVVNLLDNAVRYAKREITISVDSNGDREIVIGVEDDGPGFPDEKPAALFDKFVQLDRLRSRKGYKGTGLGLSICKEIVSAHGGRIWAKNLDGKGAGFFIALPRALPQEKAAYH